MPWRGAPGGPKPWSANRGYRAHKAHFLLPCIEQAKSTSGTLLVINMIMWCLSSFNWGLLTGFWVYRTGSYFSSTKGQSYKQSILFGTISCSLAVHADQRRAPHVFILWAEPPPKVWSMSSYEDIGVHTATSSPRAPCIVMQHAILRYFEQWGLMSPTSREVAQAIAMVFQLARKTVDHH